MCAFAVCFRKVFRVPKTVALSCQIVPSISLGPHFGGSHSDTSGQDCQVQNTKQTEHETRSVMALITGVVQKQHKKGGRGHITITAQSRDPSIESRSD